MIFDVFHSVSDPIVSGKRLGAEKSVKQFLSQAALAECLGADTLWLAESHFSSEVQKTTSVATIPNFHGEVGLNCDSFQFLHLLLTQTKNLNLGTGIHNIVGGSGGPIASAERVNAIHFLNQAILQTGRALRFGVAAGRFPYQNTPFGILPRSDWEKANWNEVRRFVFLEALEVFLRLLRGETLSSSQVTTRSIQGTELRKRWEFESLKLVPETKDKTGLEVVLGSADPLALDLGLSLWDLDLFNLSFTPPEQLEALQKDMAGRAEKAGRVWRRSRLPRTVMVFIDPDKKKARALADAVLDTYVEAMRGTAQVPDKAVLLQRALVGDAAEVTEQLSPGAARGFHKEDRLMLWFEFNQLDGARIESQMRYFFEKVAVRFS